MPKLVDREQRRRDVAAALWRLAHRDGWDAVSLRAVAAEAGLSLGSVQHYFSGVDDLLDYAVSGVLDVLDAGAARQLAALAGPADPVESVTAVLLGMIPGSAELSTGDDAAVWRIQLMAWLAVVERAAHRSVMAARLSRGSAVLEQAISNVIRDARPDRSARDAHAQARGLLALVEGLLLQMTRGDIDPGAARRVIERVVAVTFAD